jgi:hypothetical protein
MLTDLTQEIREVGTVEEENPFWRECSKNDDGKAVCKYCLVELGTPYKGRYGKLDRVKRHFGFDKDGITRLPFSNKRSLCTCNPFQTGGLSMKKQRITDHATPPVTVAVQADFNTKIARWWYQTGTPFNKSNKQFQAAIGAVRPGLTVPSRRQLAGTLLDNEFEKVRDSVNKHLTKTEAKICVSSDGWSTQDNIALINYMAVADGSAFFFDGKFSGSRKTARYISEELNEMIKRLGGPTKVVGVVTDNAQANQSAWKILQKKYGSLFFYGCICHTLHLLVKDIFKDTTLGFIKHEEKAKDIVKFFKSHQREAFTLAEMRESLKLESLKLPGATRWGSLLACFRSLLKNKDVLQTIVMEENFILDGDVKKLKDQKRAIKALVLDRSLFLLFEDLVCILEPVAKWITYFQSDSTMISDCFHVFIDLKQKFQVLKSSGKISEAVFTALNKWLLLRWNAGYSDVHGLSYLLDPRYLGQNMDEDNRSKTEKVLKDLGYEDELIHYKIKVNSSGTSITSEKKTTVMQWIGSLNKFDYARFPNLHSYLIRIFSCVPSSGCCERNFSDFGFIHSKSRNRLKKEKIKKLTFIYTNSRILVSDPNEDVSSDDGDSVEEPIPFTSDIDFSFVGSEALDIDMEYDDE